MGSLGRAWRGRKYSGTKLPVFLEAKNLSAFFPNDLDAVLEPIIFRTDKGTMAEGYRAEILPVICDIYLAALKANALTPAQIPIAEMCDVMRSGLSRVGIIGLVDEATGFQYVRDRLALQEILDAYLNKELAAWAQRFPEEFYKQIFRLRGWEWKGMKVNRPQVVAHYTNDFVYDRIAPGLLTELKTRMPRTETGRSQGRYHQLFTDDVGHPALAQHLHAVVALMRASRGWDEFKRLMNASFPRKGDNLELDLGEENT